MGFVVEKVGFGSVVVGYGSQPVVGIAKSFDAISKEWFGQTKFDGAVPDDTANDHESDPPMRVRSLFGDIE